MSALDDIVKSEREYEIASEMHIADWSADSAAAELAQLRETVMTLSSRNAEILTQRNDAYSTIAEQARQLAEARVFAEYVSRRALWTESTLSHSASIWLAANPAPQEPHEPDRAGRAVV